MRSTRNTLLPLLVAALLAASTLLAGAAPAGATTTREARLLVRINEARASHGLAPLHLSTDLVTSARRHSRVMAAEGLLFHTPTLTSLCCWSAIAENVGTAFSVSGVHQAFMASAPHRANILDRRMRQVGVGIIVVNGRLWVTEVFRDPR